MHVDELLAELSRVDSPAFLGTATHAGWEVTRANLEKNEREYIEFTLGSADDSCTQVFVLASGPFVSGDVPGLGKRAKTLSAQQAVDWLASIGRTARAERHKVSISSKWGKLIILVNKQEMQSDGNHCKPRS